MELTTVDFITTFTDMDVGSSGMVTGADFETMMLCLGYPPDQTARVFSILDVDKDGVISLNDWTSPECAALSHMLIRKMLRTKHQYTSSREPFRPRTTVRIASSDYAFESKPNNLLGTLILFSILVCVIL